MYLSINVYIFLFIHIEDKIYTKDLDYFSVIAVKYGILFFIYLFT